MTSGRQALGAIELREGNHTLTRNVTGANPSAVPKYVVGLAYLLLKPAR